MGLDWWLTRQTLPPLPVREGGRGRERGPGGEGSKGRPLQLAIFALNLLLLSLPVSAQPFTTTLPGTLVDAAGVTGPAGRPGVALLVAAGRDGKGAKTLLFLDPASRGLTRWAAGLHEEVNAVRAFDVAGDGMAALVAGMPGLLFTPAGGGAARRFFEQEHLDLRSVTGATAGRPWIATARAGLLELLGRGPEGGLARLASFPLPLEAQRPRWGLRIASPPVTLLPGDPPLFAVGPKEEGRRLQTLLIPAGGEPAVESWSLLPAGERLMDDRRYLRFDGVPALAVASFEKVGLLAKKRFRLFLVQQDRSRRGGGPVLTVDTDCPLWLPLDAMSGDADGDGRKDLVLAHPGGLRGKEMLALRPPGTGRRPFRSQAPALEGERRAHRLAVRPRPLRRRRPRFPAPHRRPASRLSRRSRKAPARWPASRRGRSPSPARRSGTTKKIPRWETRRACPRTLSAGGGDARRRNGDPGPWRYEGREDRADSPFARFAEAARLKQSSV